MLKAGRFALKEYDGFNRRKVGLKSKREIITKVDLGSEKILLTSLRKNCPETGYISEEAGSKRRDNKAIWIIDPIDGTTNYSIHNPLWAISVGLAVKNEVVLGMVYAPALNEFYVAEKDKGAYCYRVSGSKLVNRKKLIISGVDHDKIIHTFCHGSSMHDLQVAMKYYKYQKTHGLDCRQLGSASLELAYVAGGRVESIMIPGANSYDVSAGALLVREAGGRVTDFFGKKWTLQSKDILASNGKIHGEVVRITRKL